MSLLFLSCIACFAASFEAPEPVTLETSIDTVRHETPIAQATTTIEADRLAAVTVYERAWVKPHVGKMVLAASVVSFHENTKTSDGYARVPDKPNIISELSFKMNNGFNGLGHNHFARADV